MFGEVTSTPHPCNSKFQSVRWVNWNLNFQSTNEFKALPHLTIARDDRTAGIDYLTGLNMDEYDRIWGEFHSDFWRFKKSIFGVKQTGFCYAGAWSYYVDLTTGEARQCYCGEKLGDIFGNPNEKLPEKPIGRCEFPHCFNGHMLMAAGLIPDSSTIHYGDIRNRKMIDGNAWLREDLLKVFNEKIFETNTRIPENEEKRILRRKDIGAIGKRVARVITNMVKR